MKSFIDDVFAETLNEALAREDADCGKKSTVVGVELVYDTEWLSIAFEREANFIVSRY